MVDLATLLEPERLDALRRLALENLEPEEPFDRLTRLAATACSAPTALITFVGSDREHFKSALGLPAQLSNLRELPLTHSLCQYAVATGMSYAVPDTTHDPLILASPAVTELGVMAYAGAPLITSQGHCVGTISVVDWRPRPWTDEQLAMLEDLARIAITELELRNELVERAQAHVALRESEQRLRLTLDAGKCGIWDWDIPNDKITWSDRVFQVFGISPENFGGRVADFRAAIHPEDRDRVGEAVRRALEEGEDYTVEFRAVHPDTGETHWVWTNGRVLFDEDGRPMRMLGATLDTTDRRVAEESLRASHEQLRQLAHRLDEVREEELTLISREIHDELGHALTALRLNLSWIIPKLQRNRAPVREKAGELLAMVDTTIDSVRRIAAGMRPPVLDDLGLTAALESLLQRFGGQTGIQVELDAGTGDVPIVARRGLYRIVQEALTNVARHARAHRVRVELDFPPDRIVLEVTDDGVGTPARAIDSSRSLGLVGMRERAAALGATFELRSASGQGTTIRVVLAREGDA